MNNHINFIFLLMFSYSILNAQFSSLGSNFENWRILHQDKILVGWKNDGKIDWCRSRSIIDAPMQKVQKVIEYKINYPKVFKRIEITKIITDEIVYIALDMPFPFAGRDYVVKYIQQKDGTDFLYRFYSVLHDEAPLDDDFVRLINAAGEWRLKSLNFNQTEITYTWNGELLGDFPDWALTRAWKQQGIEVMTWLKETLEN